MQAVEHFIKQFVPEHYDLFLDLSRETKTFSGKVTITGQAQSDRISLHQKDLEITSVEVAGQARPFTVDHDNEALHIELAEAGQVELVLAFSGKITDNMTGIYLLIIQLMESRRRSCLLSSRAILRAKLSHVWMSLKPKQLLTSLFALTKQKVNWPCQTCQKSMLKTVRKQVSGSLRQHLACLLTCWPFLLVICKG